MKVSRGFTLVELAIVLILLGVIAMMGINTFVQITRASKDLAQQEENENVMRAVLQYVQSQGKIPGQNDFRSIISGKRDTFGNHYTYTPAITLDNETICAYTGATDFALRFCHDAACNDSETIDNVSFVFLSHGSNSKNNSVLTNTPRMLSLYLSDEEYDDMVEYYTLLELKAAAQCGLPENKYAVRFMTNTLPPINKSNANNAKFGLLAVDSKDPHVKWCVTNFTNIANFSDSNKIKMNSGTQTIFFRNNCSDINNFDVGNRHFNIVTPGIGSDKDPKIASFDVYVMDNRSAPIKKTFLYQLFYNP